MKLPRLPRLLLYYFVSMKIPSCQAPPDTHQWQHSGNFFRINSGNISNISSNFSMKDIFGGKKIQGLEASSALLQILALEQAG